MITDPHAYRTLMNGYPKLVGTFAVRHVTEVLAERLPQLKPLLKKKVNATVTYHDSCCLGRKTGHYDEPRALLNAIPGLKIVEMIQNRESSLCCGGGGSTVFLDRFSQERVKNRLADQRIQQAAATGAEVLAVACPFEPARFEDAVKLTGNEGKMAVKDVIELVAESMELA